MEELSSILLPRKGCFGLLDYEKAYCPDLKNGPDIFDLRGIDREKGAMVVVCPDQYVSNVLPLDPDDELALPLAQKNRWTNFSAPPIVWDGRTKPDQAHVSNS